MTLPVATPQTPEELAAALRQEAEFRARAIQQFRDIEKRVREQEAKLVELVATLAERNTYIHSLHLEQEKENARVRASLGEKDAYIHSLHLEKESWTHALHEARADVEQYAWLTQRLQSDFSHIENGVIQKLIRTLVRSDRALHGESEAPLLGGDDVYHLDPSPFQVFKRKDFVVGGWIRPRSQVVAALRVRIRGRSFVPTASVVPSPNDAGTRSFSIPVEIPTGHSLLRFEAADVSGVWRSVLNAPVWRPDSTSA
jgi:hypothetical protein